MTDPMTGARVVAWSPTSPGTAVRVGSAGDPAGRRGLSNREIGAQLFLSHRPIEQHLYRFYPKLGVAERRELADHLSS